MKINESTTFLKTSVIKNNNTSLMQDTSVKVI
jgi:hypothetical protein